MIFMNITARWLIFMNIILTKKVGRQLLRGPMIFMNVAGIFMNAL